MTQDTPLSLPTALDAWHQPTGWWRERGASEACLRLACNLDPGHPESECVDALGYTLWHYWAEGAHPERWIESLAKVASKKYRNQVAHNGEHPWHRLMLRGNHLAAQGYVDMWGVPTVTTVSADGDSLLGAACWSGSNAAVRFLIENDLADVDHLDAQKMTALMVAIHRCDSSIIADLVHAGADPDLADTFGRSALHHAAIAGLEDLFPLLEDAGADSGRKDFCGHTAYDLAARSHREASSESQALIHKAYWNKRYQARLTF